MSTTCRDEHSLSRLLVNSKAFYPVVVIQFPTKVGVQVELLGMNGVMLVLTFKLLSQESPEFLSVFCSKEIPGGTSRLTIWSLRGIEHNVDSTGHVHVETCASLATWALI